MRHLRAASVGVWLPVLLIALCCPAQATVLRALGEWELAQRATAIVVGTVTDRQARWLAERSGNRRIVTEIRLRVRQWVKGGPGREVNVQVPGGMVGEQWEYIPGAPQFSLGENVLLFLEPTTPGALGVLGWSQGRYSIVNGAVRPSGLSVEDATRRIADYATGRVPASAAPTLRSVSPQAAPTITNIQPPSAAGNTDTVVTITGTGFGAAPGKVQFPHGSNKNDAAIVDWSDTVIHCKVPTADSGGVQVVRSDSVPSAPYSYTITFNVAIIKWPNSALPVGLRFNEVGTPDTTGEFDALRAALNTWLVTTGMYFHAYEVGMTTAKPHVDDDLNVLGWIETGWTYGSQTIGQCRIRGTTSGTEEADIAFNGEHFTWSTSGFLLPGRVDVQQIATHELGHLMGFADIYGTADSAKMMYGFSPEGAPPKRSLAIQDEDGLRFLYPGKPTVALGTNSLVFNSNHGAVPPAQSLPISNPGVGFLSWRLVIPAAAPWLSATPLQGNQDLGGASVSVNPAGLALGDHSAQIQVVGPPGSAGSPQTADVVLHVTLQGDIDGNGSLSAADLRAFIAAWRKFKAHAADWAKAADLDKDNDVDWRDAQELAELLRTAGAW